MCGLVRACAQLLAVQAKQALVWLGSWLVAAALGSYYRVKVEYTCCNNLVLSPCYSVWPQNITMTAGDGIQIPCLKDRALPFDNEPLAAQGIWLELVGSFFIKRLVRKYQSVKTETFQGKGPDLLKLLWGSFSGSGWEGILPS